MVLISDTARFELSLDLRNDMVNTVRRFIEQFYSQLFGDEDLAYRLGLAAHELLENAIKSSIIDNVTMSIEVRNGVIDVCTRNRANLRDIAVLKQSLDEINAEDDPAGYYQRLMSRLAESLEADGSGLGLGRIWAEADMSLSCETESDMVYVHAQTPIPGGEA